MQNYKQTQHKQIWEAPTNPCYAYNSIEGTEWHGYKRAQQEVGPPTNLQKSPLWQLI